MLGVLDLKYLGLIVSVGVAVALRFFSDFSFATIQHQAALANVRLGVFSVDQLAALAVTTLRYQLQRDWFNLSPQAPLEIFGMVVALVIAYGVLRRLVRTTPDAAAAAVLVVTPWVALVASLGACAWVLARAARAA